MCASHGCQDVQPSCQGAVHREAKACAGSPKLLAACMSQVARTEHAAWTAPTFHLPPRKSPLLTEQVNTATPRALPLRWSDGSGFLSQSEHASSLRMTHLHAGVHTLTQQARAHMSPHVLALHEASASVCAPARDGSTKLTSGLPNSPPHLLL